MNVRFQHLAVLDQVEALDDLYEYHPTFRLGAKLGDWSTAIAEKLKLPAKQPAPKTTPAV